MHNAQLLQLTVAVHRDVEDAVPYKNCGKYKDP